MAAKIIGRMALLLVAATVIGFSRLSGIHSAMLGGLVAPIEVIEEWGCYSTEIRLTCGDLESKLAILEAKFTPRCREERSEDCVYVDENSVAHSFSSRKIDKLALEEKEAGQRFLQTLRRNHEHKRSREETSPSVGAVHEAGSAEPVNVRTVKDKRSSLRTKLEHLIVRYLRRFTSSGEDEETDESGGHESSSSRYRRQVSIDGNGSVIDSVGGDNLTDVYGNKALESSVEITLLTNNDTDSGNGSVVEDSRVLSALPIIGTDVVDSVDVLASTVVANAEDKMSKFTDDSDESENSPVNDRLHHRMHECGSMRKRITQLDKFEIQKSMQNDSFHEYNIRNALNYRCSGKNHCSFVFSQDHPFAVVWREGTIRVKYICMDDFRISKYCDEHLIIGNEDQWERRRGNSHKSNSERAVSGAEAMPVNGDSTAKGGSLQEDSGAGNANDRPVGFTEDRESQWSYNDNGDYDDEDDNEESEYNAGYGSSPRGEPRAEALQQGQQQILQMHSFHNLKILKALPGEEAPLNETEKQRKLDADTANRQRQRQRQKVFSQDFRVLKILPSDLDEVEDIKQVGNEYYFKKDIEVIDDSENEIIPGRSRNDSAQFSETLDIVVLPQPAKDVDVYESNLDPSLTIADNVGKTTVNMIELISPTIGTGSVSTTSQKQTYLDVSVHSTAVTVTGMVNEGRATLKTGSGPSTPLTTMMMAGGVEGKKSTVKYPDVGSNEIEGIVRFSNKSEDEDGFNFNNRTFKKMQDAVLKEISEKEPAGSNGYPVNYDFNDGDDEEEDNDDNDDDDYDESDKRSHRKYISIQRTLLKNPLRQGFLMTPGYPKYYIGDSVCRWTLYARQQQKIKLTILDLALRIDEPCRDYIEIRDLNTNQTLFSSCSESTRPIEVISLQERLEVNVRTTTKVAYPKRGVLIHYSALGCELPTPTPPHMTLVRRSERRVKYVCDPLYVFPDTAEPSRELVCTSKQTWNRPLPACVEKRATEGSGLVSHYEQKRKASDSDMSDKQADTVYDILIPSMVIAALFIVNGIVFAVIMRYRNKRKQRLELDSKELAEL
ncbi:uncharacterized protein LOC129731601 [Wyeomyia smithii]|uniref:uncharacterized protein LOC129731601 n=1 Tax=Wyeomyia smithii TaxID=174621 RepID=UPI0024681432|nr:uncharacterized protein LOC129731601 [Wyeomyia smithii]